MKRITQRILTFGGLATAALGIGWFWAARAQEKAIEFRPVQVAPPFPAIQEFPIIAAEHAAGWLDGHELVLGVTVGEESRAYPINMLTGPAREILNDELGGTAIAATW